MPITPLRDKPLWLNVVYRPFSVSDKSLDRFSIPDACL